jgi:hypothetical protein
MRRLTQACGLVLVCATLALGGDPLPAGDVQLFFFVDYTQVKNRLKGGKGLGTELIAVNEADLTGVLAKFWMQRALDHCKAVIWPGESVYKVLEDTEPCRHSYYVDHWDEINQMIRAQYQALKKQGKK